MFSNSTNDIWFKFTEALIQALSDKNLATYKTDDKPKKRSPALLNSRQAGKLLGLSPKTLANWRVQGFGPEYRKIGGRCLYQRQDVMKFRRSCRATSTSAYTRGPK